MLLEICRCVLAGLQSFVSKIWLLLDGINCSVGGRPKLYSTTNQRACASNYNRWIRTTHVVGNHMREELYAGISDSNVTRVLHEADLKCKVKQQKSKLIVCQIMARLEFAKHHTY